MSKVYPLKNGKPEMRRSVVLMLDILGYKELARKASPKVLHDLWDALQHAREAFPRERPSPYEMQVFTDCIVIGYPILDHADGEGELGDILLDTAQYQLALAMRGYFVRGGISIGLHFMDRNTVFGPALVESYTLEQEEAKYPRVVLSKEAAAMALAHTDFYGRPREAPQNTVLLVDDDEQCFVNYLEGDPGNFDDPEEGRHWLLHEALPAHRKRVENELKRHAGKRKILQKYRWTATYHNYVARKLYPGRKGLLIAQRKKSHSFQLIRPKGGTRGQRRALGRRAGKAR